MFSRFHKYVALAILSACSLAIVGQALASTATFTPTGAVTGTSGASRLALITARKTMSCTTTGATVTLGNNTAPLPIVVSTDLIPLFGALFGGGSCTITGGAGITIDCSRSPNTLKATNVTSGGMTNVSMSGIRCAVRLNGSSTCSVDVSGPVVMGTVTLGSVTGSFTNSPSRISVNVGGQSLATTNSTCATLPSDSNVSFTDSSGNPVVYSLAPSTTLSVV